MVSPRRRPTPATGAFHHTPPPSGPRVVAAPRWLPTPTTGPGARAIGTAESTLALTTPKIRKIHRARAEVSRRLPRVANRRWSRRSVTRAAGPAEPATPGRGRPVTAKGVATSMSPGAPASATAAETALLCISKIAPTDIIAQLGSSPAVFVRPVAAIPRLPSDRTAAKPLSIRSVRPFRAWSRRLRGRHTPGTGVAPCPKRDIGSGVFASRHRAGWNRRVTARCAFSFVGM